MNNCVGEIFPYHKDISEIRNSHDSIRSSLQNRADRLIMNLPERSLNFLDVACVLMKKSGGILHIYQFAEKPGPIENAKVLLENKLNKLKWKIENITNSKVVKAFSPKADLIVIDAIIKEETSI